MSDKIQQLQERPYVPPPPQPDPTIVYEEPVKPTKVAEKAPLLPAEEVVDFQNGANVPYIPPPDFNWEPGKEYVVGQPVEVAELYYPQGHKQPEGEIPQGVAFKQQNMDFKQGKYVANKGCHCTGCWPCSFLTGIIVLGSIAVPLVLNEYAWFALPGSFYLIHLIILCTSDTCKFLSKLDLKVNPYTQAYNLQHTPPVTVWHITCYHWETRFRTVTERDSNGNTRTRTETYQEKVITHTNSHTVHYRGWQDASPILSGLEQYRMTRIYNRLTFAFGSDAVRHQFHCMRREWIHFNDRDVHYDFSEAHKLPGMVSHVLTFNDKPKNFPCCLNCCAFTFLGFLTLDWVLMFWLMRYSARLDYRFVKVVHLI